MECDLSRHLLPTHCGGYRQESEARQTFDITLHMIRVAHLHTHQLVPTTDAQYGGTLAMSLHDGLCHPITTQLIEVVERRFRSRDNDDVSLADILHIIGIEEMYARILFEGIEVGIVREVLQHHHGDVHLPMCQMHRLLSQCHTVFLLDMDILEIRNDAQDGNPADLLQHPFALLEESQVATELIDDDAFDELTVFWCL